MWVIYFASILAVSLVLGLIGSFLSAGESDPSTSKEVYECGIEPLVMEKTPFYLHFFPVGVLFLLFDVELVVCLPLIGVVISSPQWEMVWTFIVVILLFGLILETMMGTLDWKE